MEFSLVGPAINVASRAFAHWMVRRALRVQAHLCWESGYFARGSPGMQFLNFEVLNVGEKPVVLAGCGFAWGPELRLWTRAISPSWCMAGESEHRLEPGIRYRAIVKLIPQVLDSPGQLRSVWARDTLDREYPITPARLPALRAEIAVSNPRGSRTETPEGLLRAIDPLT